jgi:hypothetical protein
MDARIAAVAGETLLWTLFKGPEQGRHVLLQGIAPSDAGRGFHNAP